MGLSEEKLGSACTKDITCNTDFKFQYELILLSEPRDK